MGRIEERFQALQRQRQTALVVYVTAGDPSLRFTRRLIPLLDESGADVIEIGVPFSDPLADGPTIQAASQRALQSGTNLRAILEMVRELRATVSCPLTLMSYANPLFHYGYERTAAAAARAGVDGFLVPDLPHEEAGALKEALTDKGVLLIPFLAPTTTPQRASRILKQAEGFVYYVSLTGTTGARRTLPTGWQTPLLRFKRISPVPICVGFGLSTVEQIAAVARWADGVVIGSALIQAMASCRNDTKRLRIAQKLVRCWASVVHRKK